MESLGLLNYLPARTSIRKFTKLAVLVFNPMRKNDKVHFVHSAVRRTAGSLSAKSLIQSLSQGWH
jgi:hypothetical protein